MPRKDPFRFDFALSFSGAQRLVAQEITEGLIKSGFTVFYDKDQVHELLGKDGEIYLRKLYSAEARFYIVLVSRQYDTSFWTNLELDAIRSRELIEHEGVLLPVIVGSFRPKWLSRELIFFDLRESSVPALVEVLRKKVSRLEERTNGNVYSNASDCQVFVSSADRCTEQYAHFTQEAESKLRGLGLRVEHSDGPRSPEIFPIVKCAPEDRLVGLQVKAVIDTLLRRHGPLKGELEGEVQVQLGTRGASVTSPRKLTLYL